MATTNFAAAREAHHAALAAHGLAAQCSKRQWIPARREDTCVATMASGSQIELRYVGTLRESKHRTVSFECCIGVLWREAFDLHLGTLPKGRAKMIGLSVDSMPTVASISLAGNHETGVLAPLGPSVDSQSPEELSALFHAVARYVSLEVKPQLAYLCDPVALANSLSNGTARLSGGHLQAGPFMKGAILAAARQRSLFEEWKRVFLTETGLTKIQSAKIIDAFETALRGSG